MVNLSGNLQSVAYLTRNVLSRRATWLSAGNEPGLLITNPLFEAPENGFYQFNLAYPARGLGASMLTTRIITTADRILYQEPLWSPTFDATSTQSNLTTSMVATVYCTFFAKMAKGEKFNIEFKNQNNASINAIVNNGIIGTWQRIY
jgi:hypothetical protein